MSGWVVTDMGDALAEKLGMQRAPMSVEKSVTGIVKLLDESTRNTHGGKLWNVSRDGVVEMSW